MGEFDNKKTPITYLVGVLLGINAIKDSYLWVDSPDCFFFKNDFVQGNHDINSCLRKADGNHKILPTISDVDNVVGDRNEKFIKTLKNMASKDFVKQIFVSSMPMSQMIGTDYDGVINEVKQSIDKDIFNIPSRSMTDCWLEGYSDLLFSLSKNINVKGGNQKKENIAIVGNLFDRNEGDCIANVNELRRIIEGLGLNLVSVWLDGGDYENVLKVKDAGTIISLPYGRKAAKKISKRLGADLLELDLPFGLDKTGEFIKKISNHFEINDLADKFIEKELTEFNQIDILKWVIPKVFANKKISFYSDPYLLNGFIDLSKTLGFSLGNIYIHGDEKHLKNNKDIDISDLNIEYGLEEMFSDDTDLFVTNSHSSNSKIKEPSYNRKGGIFYKKMEFGFPSYNYHVYTYEPYFGYKGTLSFINRVANTLNN